MRRVPGFWLVLAIVAAAFSAPPAASQAVLEWIVLSGGPISIAGTVPQCPTAVPGNLYVIFDFTGIIQGNEVSSSGGGDYDLVWVDWARGTLDCGRAADGGLTVTSSRDATIVAGVGVGSRAA